MTCLSCGMEAPADSETGYCADAVCPACAREGWEVTSDGELVGPNDTRSTVSDVSDIPRRMVRADLPRRTRRTSIG